MKKTPRSPEPGDRYVGARVRQARLLIGISQEKLADALGLTFQQVQKYERGTNRIGAARLQRIATELRKPVAWFFDGGKAEGGELKFTRDDPLADLGATADGVRLSRAVNKITDPSKRSVVVRVAEALAA